MDSTSCVEQKGIIESIKGGIATVNITSFSACASCQSKGACGMTESEEKHVDVRLYDQQQYKVGEPVIILMKKSLGLKATLLAYVLPFLVVLIALIVLKELGISEALSGLISIGGLALYFFILYLNRNKLQKTFQFSLKKVN